MKQQFIITNSIMDEKALKLAAYSYSGRSDRDPVEAHFAGIPMIKHNLNPSADVSIVAIITEAGNYANNFELYKKELEKITEETGIELVSKIKVIKVPYDESREKHIAFFTELCKLFEEDAELYMDVTFGSKVTPISEFASLVYAENAKKCNIKEVIYGKVIAAEKQEIYDIKCLYHMAQLISTASHNPYVDLEELLNSFEKDEK